MPPDRPQKFRGLVCPDCGVGLRTIRTKRPARNLVVRRRECPGCGLRLTTDEKPRLTGPWPPPAGQP